ncbi:class I adenylate-forming enzyme family protein [Mycobacterium asiaticum]|uniref:AMP-dependent synthetase n=1 Tax=Mycobacterium asiaticum TaxID=1790 RepID=A0A1A3MSZ9_MYCAS|nr:AMP-binding protein [Mycobacterium asiaticum]OBK12651.1 AMP-dependent synthetase [Mycobacterium asiaticum]
MAVHPLSRRIADVLDLQPDSSAVEYDGEWLSWGQIGAAARHIASLSQGPDAGVLLRNRPAQMSAFLGVLLGGGTVVTLNPSRGDDRTRADIQALRLPLVIGEPQDLAALVIDAPDTVTVSTAGIFDGPAASPTSAGACSGVAVRMLTSGTTGPPKRIDLSYDMLAHSTMGRDYRDAPTPTGLRRGVAIVNSPLVHIGGVFRVLQCVAQARPFVLLDRFDLTQWVAAVRKHRPRTVSLVPAALRTVLHSDLTREDLSSIRAVTCGTAPLSADDADAFTDKYGIPVLTSYAATEFGGGVAGWTLADHEQYWKDKRGSVGRANPGTQLRVVDDDGAQLAAEQVGRLEVKPAQLGSSTPWMRTTDLARIDTEGFVWIVGRADQAIIRGGFKVMPDDVRNALENHPAVSGAAVIGRHDDRLGEIPVAMVELRGSASTQELVEYLRTRLARYEIPADIAVVEALPRTPSGKADLGAIRDYFDTADHAR